LRQAGHQQAAGCPGTGKAAGNSVHQHGPARPSAIAQPNRAPQRLQVLMGPVLYKAATKRGSGWWAWRSYPGYISGTGIKIQQDRHIMDTALARKAVKFFKIHLDLP
jgi:hypothetical protein